MKEEILGQEPAFPVIDANSNLSLWNAGSNPTGMSKRFYAACAAMQGVLSNKNIEVSVGEVEFLTELSYMLADELLKQENE